MRAPSESDYEQRLVNDAFGMGVPSAKLAVRADTGWPDRIFFIVGGRPLILEMKKDGERPRPKQVHKIGILERLGYDVGYVDNYADGIKSVEHALLRATAASGPVEPAPGAKESRKVSRRA